jgi:hypothetical protein
MRRKVGVLMRRVMMGRNAEAFEQFGAEFRKVSAATVSGSYPGNSDSRADARQFARVLGNNCAQKNHAISEVERFVNVVSDDDDCGRFYCVEFEE